MCSFSLKMCVFSTYLHKMCAFFMKMCAFLENVCIFSQDALKYLIFNEKCHLASKVLMEAVRRLLLGMEK